MCALAARAGAEASGCCAGGKAAVWSWTSAAGLVHHQYQQQASTSTSTSTATCKSTSSAGQSSSPAARQLSIGVAADAVLDTSCT